MRRPQLSRPARRSVLMLLMAALVLVQALGLMHRVVHVHAQLQHAAVPPLAAAGSATTAGDSWVKALFGNHDGERDCAQYDQLTHADLAWDSVPAIASRASGIGHGLCRPGWQLAAQAAGFLARGPPVQV